MTFVLTFSLHPRSDTHTGPLGPRLASPSESWGLCLQDNPVTPSVGGCSSGFSWPHLTLFQIFQGLAGLPWSRNDLGFPCQTWFLCWLLFLSFPRAVLSGSLEACKHASVWLSSSVRSWEGAHNYWGSSSVLRWWWQLFLGPGRHIIIVMPPNAHTPHTHDFFHARTDRPAYLPGQCFTRSVTAFLRVLSPGLAHGRTPDSVPGFGVGVWSGV